ncbi:MULTISPECIES: hypothetical protein [unclassified Haloferax]|uniref:hypothetical protein n=1 Tax=unclassified Haloferax TaxID=2625095 RepID=UPI0012672A41|nr:MULTISPECIES: hypothetical protein [unclassified Haloferax]
MPPSVDPYVDPSNFQAPQNQYVAWLDIMGTANAMRRSVKTAAVKVLKMHNAVIDVQDSFDVDTFPMMDGIYIVSDDGYELIDFLQEIFKGYAEYIVQESQEDHFEIYYASIIRAAIAFGPLYHGADTDDSVSESIANSGAYKDSILVGVPMADAYGAETDAPPFGIHIHQSARTLAPDGKEPIPQYWWQWWDDSGLASNLFDLLEKYFEYFEQSRHSEYNPEKIELHREMAEAYLHEDY